MRAGRRRGQGIGCIAAAHRCKQPDTAQPKSANGASLRSRRAATTQTKERATAGGCALNSRSAGTAVALNASRSVPVAVTVL